MKTIGFDQPLYILPFDHRGSFETKMFGWHGDLNASQTAEIAAAKQVIYDGFKAAIAAGVPQEKAGILVDEQFGSAILRDARTNGYHTACPAEKSSQDVVLAAAENDAADFVATTAARGGHDFLAVLHEWLATAARVKGFIGFAVGRTDFWDALVNYRAGKITRDDAVARIALRYENFVGIFEKGRPS